MLGLEDPFVPVKVAEEIVPLGLAALGSPNKKVPTGPFKEKRKAIQASASSLLSAGIVTEADHLWPGYLRIFCLNVKGDSDTDTTSCALS
jgi:hypothetical protein